jgi:hypothetical protein
MKKLSFAILTIAGALAFVAPALADTVSYNLTTIDPVVIAGGTVTFNSSIMAPSSNTGSIAILSDSFSCEAGCTIDDTDFNNTPFDLAPGESYTGPLFSVTTLSTDVAGDYDGFFDITFAAAAGNIFTDSAPFEVNIAPEPGTWLLLGTGLGGAWLLRRRFLTRAAVSRCEATAACCPFGRELGS